MSSKQVVALGSLASGTKFRLYSKYRDGSARPRYHYGPKRGGRYLAGETMTVLEGRGDAILCSVGKYTVPLYAGARILL